MFNDQFPGPVLRGHIGDIFTVTLVNDGTLGHSLDFHASKVAWNDEMRTIAPGESLVYQFAAKHAGMRSEEHTSELQSLMRISYAVFCLKKKQKKDIPNKGTIEDNRLFAHSK